LGVNGGGVQDRDVPEETSGRSCFHILKKGVEPRERADKITTRHYLESQDDGNFLRIEGSDHHKQRKNTLAAVRRDSSKGSLWKNCRRLMIGPGLAEENN